MIGLQIKTSFQYIRRSPFQALAAISILALTFFVATLIAVVMFGSNRLIAQFETRPQVILFLNKDATEAEVDSLHNKLEADSRITDLAFVSKEDAVEIYKEITVDNPLLGELVSPSTFQASLEFSVSNLDLIQQVIDQYKSEGIVEDVGFTASVGGEANIADVLNRLRSITSSVRAAGLGAVIVLGITSFLVLMVVISLRIQSRKSEIETLSLIGATKGFIRTPIVLEAINYALIGAFLGWILAVVVVLYATPTALSYFGPILPQQTNEFFGLLGIILLVELGVSILIALLGSMVAVMRAFK